MERRTLDGAALLAILAHGVLEAHAEDGSGIDYESTHAWINSGKQRCTTRDAAGAEMRQAGEWTTSDKVARLKAARIKARRQIAQ